MSMAVIAWLVVVFLNIQGCLCSVGQTNVGCLKWTQRGNDVCCDICQPGNRLVKECGPNPKELCKPCEPGTYTVNPKDYKCDRCTQCVGAQVHLKDCTATTDTKCGCKKGLTCGDDRCSFCVDECGKGFEPTKDRSCRPCPNGTFSDKIHQMCKPWSTKCSNSNEEIVAKGNALSDITCVSVVTVKSTKTDDDIDSSWSLMLSAFIIITVVSITIIVVIIIIIKSVKNLQKKKKTKKTITKTPIIRNPTDDPRTLIAIECSFHEAQQEQGSTCSTESLDSKDSSEQLIA